MKSNFKIEEGLPLHATCSLVTGLVATTVAAPFDLLKTRFVIHEHIIYRRNLIEMKRYRSMNSSKGAPSIGSIFQSVYVIVEREGALTLFRGWLPAYLRLGPHALICFPILEQIRRVFGLSYI